ncbi:MAG: VIT domain-containing protein [Gemmatimonadaceae bacterium]
MRTLPTLFALAFALPLALPAQGWIIPRPCRLDRCPPIVGNAAVARVSSDVRVQLANRVLQYEVEETFTNNGGLIGEADYLFPLPKGAAFQDLKLSIDGELVAGETMNAEEARRIYEEIVRRQRDPALVEWMGHGLLRTRIFPIAPGEKKRIVVRFQSVAEREGDALRVDYFRGTAMRRSRESWVNDREPPAPEYGRDGRVSFTLFYPRTSELGIAYSPTHSLTARDERGLRRVDVRGDARDLALLIPLRRRSEAAITVLSHSTGRDDGFALITLSPPSLPSRPTPRDVTLVLDVSGSMSGRKIEQARETGKRFLATLSSRDRFRLIDFSTDARTFRDEYLAATPGNIAEARRYFDDLRAEGSTNIEDALEEALASPSEAGRLGLVLFITDGAPSVGERRTEALVEMARNLARGRRIFAFGLGADVNVSLIEQLALEGHGTAHFVRPDESTERAVEVVASRLTNPVATNVRLRAEGARLAKIQPSGPIDIFAGQDLVLLTRYTNSGRARIRFDGNGAEGPVSWSADVIFPERERGNAFVPRLWATQRIGFLSAEKRRNGGSEEIDAEIRELGERFGIPTEFTSYFVKEPGMVVDGGFPVPMPRRRGDMVGQAGGASAPARLGEQASKREFDAARDAAAQRSATSLAVADSTMSAPEGGARARRAGNRIFNRQGNTWTDSRYGSGMKTLKVRAYSAAYFALILEIPELSDALALGDHVIVAGRFIALDVGASGSERLTEDQLREIVSAW